MRDLIVSLILVGLFPTCFKRPFVGLLVFSWLAYMRVQDLTWGFAREIRWSFYVAIITFAGYFLGRRTRPFFVADVRSWCLIGMVVLLGIGVLLSEEITERQVSRYIEFVKIVAIALFTVAVVYDKERLRIMLWVIAFSLGFYGVKSGVMGILLLGQLQVLRGPGGMLLDNNDLSLALSMAVPMLFHLGWTERNEIIRRAFWIAVPLTVITVGLTHSRGGFLSCSAAIGVLVWRSRNRVHGIAIGLLVLVAALVLAPADYKERLMTITEYETEGSAQGRIRAWGIAVRMAVDNPWFGVGFGRFGKHFVDYALDPSAAELSGKDIIVAHNSYLQIWAECGTPAILLYGILVLASFLTVWKVRRMAARRYYSSWILNYATMFEAALTAFVVGSTFLNRAHFDLFYHFVSLVMVFGIVAVREMQNEVAHPVRSAGRAELRAVARTGFDRRPAPQGFRRDLAGHRA